MGEVNNPPRRTSKRVIDGIGVIALAVSSGTERLDIYKAADGEAFVLRLGPGEPATGCSKRPRREALRRGAVRAVEEVEGSRAAILRVGVAVAVVVDQDVAALEDGRPARVADGDGHVVEPHVFEHRVGCTRGENCNGPGDVLAPNLQGMCWRRERERRTRW